MNKVITFVIQTAEADLDPILAAGVNAVREAGHIVKEVRVLSDSGEVKVALNQIKGVVDTAAEEVKTDVEADVVPAADALAAAAAPADSTVPGAPTDTPVTAGSPVTTETTTTASETIDQQREALLAQLEALDKEEEAGTTGTSDPTP